MTTDEYLDEIARTATPTPQSEGGLRARLILSLYAGGHRALDGTGATGLTAGSDDELGRYVVEVIREMRARM